MRKTLTIQIPKPCHEDWNTMTTIEKGRHCASCSKTVYDFTKATDEKIIETFESEGRICGRFKNTQLNRKLVLSRKEKNNFRTFLASGLLAFLTFGSQKSQAQNKPEIVQVDSSSKATTVKGKQAVSVLNTNLISGTVYDETGLPLPGANVMVKGTTIRTQTDFDGNFKINAKKGQIISISFVGYLKKEVTIENASTVNMEIDLEYDIVMMGEVIVTGMISSGSNSYGLGYEHISNPSFHNTSTTEDSESEHLRKMRRKNSALFYKRKNKEAREKRKENRN